MAVQVRADVTTRVLHGSVVAVAALIVAMVLYRATFGFDQSWDSVAYHIPFAARLAGLCDANCLSLLEFQEIRYQSFPLAMEMVMAALWKITGQPQAVGFVAIICLGALVAYLRAAWSVPWYWAVLALAAIPMVQAAATSAYVDVAANCLATIGLLTLLALLIRPGGIRRWEVVVFLVCIVLLGNTKTQMMPVAGILAVIFILMASRRTAAGAERAFALSSPLGWAAGLALCVALSATGIHNLLEFGNPVYPVTFELAGRTIFVGNEQMSAANSVSLRLKHLPPPLIWLMSVFELSALNGRTPIYTLDMATPIDWVSFRMGGYCGVYVFMSLGFLVLALRQLPGPLAKRVGIAFALLTLVTACLPSAHELRYYMFWMFTLVGVNLALCFAPVFADFRERQSIAALFKFAIIGSFAAVTTWTAALYLRPEPGLNQILATGIKTVIDHEVSDGDLVCVAEMNRAFFYTTTLHKGRNYKVMQGVDPRCDVQY